MALKIIAGSASRELAADVCRLLDITPVVCRTSRFADGEIGIQIEENVRGCDVFVLQSTSTPVNDNIMELFLIIDALKRASVKRITAVIPYFGYARQDRKTKPRVPISAALVAELVETAGANRVLSVDLHCGQIQGFFRIPVDNIYAAPVLYSYFLCGPQVSAATISSVLSVVSPPINNSDGAPKNVLDSAIAAVAAAGASSSTSANLQTAISNSRIMVISPDAGGAERADQFRNGLESCGIRGIGMGMMNKQRKEANAVHSMELIGNVQDADVIIVDDMIDTAGTLCAAAAVLKNNGARRIFACATHPILSSDAVARIEASCIERVIVTNTIKLPEGKQSHKIVHMSIGHLLSEAIRRVHNEETLHPHSALM